MIPITVMIQYMNQGAKESRRMKLSMDATVSTSIAQIIAELALPIRQDNQPISYYLIRQRQILEDKTTLMEIGVEENEILQLTVLDPKATMGQALSGSIMSRLGGKTGSEPLTISAALALPSGSVFCHLKHTRALVGRADAKLGYTADSLDADLTSLDPNLTVSRPHAMIAYHDNQFTICDLYSQTGVVINGVKI